MKQVEIVSTGAYLPGEPVPFDSIDDLLGELNNVDDRMKGLIPKIKSKIKKEVDIDQCYFAIDPKTKKINDTVASMATKAIRNALDRANMKTSEIECMILGIPIPDHIVPPTSTYVQSELGLERCSEIEVHSNCTSITKALQIAFDSLRVGRYKNVIVGYSQLSSAFLKSDYFNQKEIKMENLFLRWFLSDSASALVLKAKDNIESGLKLLEVYNESLGGNIETGMWLNLGSANFNLPKCYAKGNHHVGQNYKLVNQIAPDIGIAAVDHLVRYANLPRNEIDMVFYSVPSYNLYKQAQDLVLNKYNIPVKKWFSNTKYYGYSGGSSLIIGLHDILEQGLLGSKEILICATIESSNWMVGNFALKNMN